MSYNQWSTPSSHQQAFPPYPAQSTYTGTYTSPSTNDPRYHYNIQNPLTNSPPYYAPSSSVYVQPDLEPQRQGQGRSRGYEYLKSLNTSMSQMSVNPANVSPQNSHAPPPGNNRNNGSYTSPQSRIRLYSDPNSPTTSPNYNKRLPALPPPPPPYPPPPPPSLFRHSSTRYNACSSMLDAGPSKQDLIPPPIPPRPTSLPLLNTSEPATVYPTQVTTNVNETPPRSSQISGIPTASPPPKSPLKTFRPSVHPHSKPRISDENRLRPPSPHTPPRPYSDSAIPTSKNRKGKSKATSSSQASAKKPSNKQQEEDDPDWNPIIDLTLDPSDSNDSSVENANGNITPRSPARRKRATSEKPTRASAPDLKTPSKVSSAANTPARSKTDTPGVVQCSGYTRSGQSCKRTVKALAPYLASRDTNIGEGDERSDRVMGRYCKDHAGMICQAEGFYWRNGDNQVGIWIRFDDYIPSDLGQQTQTLLRMTMESKLTAKESPGYLYAYELRDLETPSIAYFKVGRTDNVPRRIGEWTNQCQSKKPTLRDIFPLPAPKHARTSSYISNENLKRSDTLTTSFLPGATKHLNPPSKAMKRWERLVHLELSDRSHQSAYQQVREKCVDCGLSHKEIFPICRYPNGDESEARNKTRVYEDIVMEVICRWDRFIKRITQTE